jgi:heme exporter protein CcmB
MTRGIHQVALLIGKDLRLEARTRQTAGLVVVLGTLIVVVLGLGLGAGRPVTGFGATSILWVAYLFGGILCFEKTMAVERNDDVLSALLVAPMDRGVLYVAKLVTNLVLMVALAVVITPIAIVLFRFDLSAAPIGFAIVMLLGMTGFAAVGTLFAAVASSTQFQSGLLAMLVFPLSLPVVIVSTQIMRRLFEGGEPLSGSALGILVAFDVIFLVVSWLVFELVLEP